MWYKYIIPYRIRKIDWKWSPSMSVHISANWRMRHEYVSFQPILAKKVYTGWSKNHAIHIKIFNDSCNSIQFDCINKHTISLWLYRSRHVVTCSRQSVSYLSTVAVQGCLQNEFRDTFPDSPVPNKSTVSRLVNRFRHCRNSWPGCMFEHD
jgi:hypothetical protein